MQFIGDILMYKQRDFENLWAKYEGLLNSLKDENISKLLEEHGQRIIMTSFSQREKEPFCGIGGIVDYSLRSNQFPCFKSKFKKNEHIT